MPGWLEVVIRASVGVIIVLFASKVLVRKPVSHLTYFEWISMAAVAIIVAIGSFQLTIPPAFIILSLVVWILVPYFIDVLSMKSQTFRNMVRGKGIPFIKDGKVLEDNLKKQRYSSDELLSQLRSKQVFKVADVEFAILEPSGDINVLLKKDYQPLTASDMQIPVAPIKEPETVVMDGKILDEPLSTLGFNRRWLEQKLEKMGVAIENVYLGQIDSFGEVTVDLFDDKIKVPQPVEKPLLLAQIKKCQADLEAFALQTDNGQAKKMYERNSKEMQQVLTKIKPYLK
ncbi:DUF421 domain-containing protein [Bacillus alkalicellulosilyticus]|uniref:DUF421 domain-containing protein n=1 Tax=Alkalihalobacterium alkalicellulosilyticum TaxID=1912214 RepID=UPI0009982127|nr:DUF421 domain-containing protein [Bacillus alkalicellulosilyticus]